METAGEALKSVVEAKMSTNPLILMIGVKLNKVQSPSGNVLVVSQKFDSS